VLLNDCRCICGTYLLCELTEAKSHTSPPKEGSFNWNQQVPRTGQDDPCHRDKSQKRTEFAQKLWWRG